MLLSGPSSAYIALLFCSPQPMRWERLLRSCQEMWMPAHCQSLWQEREKQRQKVTISVAKRHPLRKTQGFEKEATMEEGWEEAAPRATEGCFLQPALEAQPEAFVCTYLHRAAGLKTPASKACVSTRDTHTRAHKSPVEAAESQQLLDTSAAHGTWAEELLCRGQTVTRRPCIPIK